MKEVEYITFFFILILFNLILIYKYKSIAQVFKIYDIPNQNRKLHKSPVPLIGGLILLINLLIYIGFEFIFINKVFLPDTYYLNNLF